MEFKLKIQVGEDVFESMLQMARQLRRVMYQMGRLIEDHGVAAEMSGKFYDDKENVIGEWEFK